MNLVPYRQALVSRPIADLPAAVRERLEASAVVVPRGKVAVTAGSRGIANIPVILRACVDWLRDRGAEPFVVPAMGSHNGGTAEGQRAMLASLGMTEEAVGAPIRSSMETVTIGEVAQGPVAMDRFAYEAEGVLVVNRVKRHTSFGGPPFGSHVESGLSKMMVVGLGKLESARTFHAAPTMDKPAVLAEMTDRVLATGKVIGALAILEDGYDQTAELHAMGPTEVPLKEPGLLAHHAGTYFPKLPVDELNVLVVEQIGKDFSGSGMDTNVIGRRGLSDAPDPPTPSIAAIGALGLSEASQGNGLGVGMCDVITQRLLDAIDTQKSLLNATTAGEPGKAKPPEAVVPTDEALFDWLRERHGDERWVVIPNTLHLGELRVSEDLLDELP